MPLPRFIADLAGTFRDFFVNGDIRTRKANTGGGDVLTRHLWHGPVSYHYFADENGNRIFGHGPDGHPALSWCFFIGSIPGGSGFDPIVIDLVTGETAIPKLRTTTQPLYDNSTLAASTEYVDRTSIGGITLQLGPDPGLKSSNPLDPQVRYFKCPANYTLTGWSIVCEPSCTLSIDIWKHAHPTLPTISNSITGGNPITITGASSNTGSLAGWSTAELGEGDMIAMSLTSNNTATWFSLLLHGRKG